MRLTAFRALAVITMVVLLAPSPAYAYIDPGTGSFVFQTIAAVVIGLIFMVRSSWHRVRESLRRLFGPRRGG